MKAAATYVAGAIGGAASALSAKGLHEVSQNGDGAGNRAAALGRTATITGTGTLGILGLAGHAEKLERAGRAGAGLQHPALMGFGAGAAAAAAGIALLG